MKVINYFVSITLIKVTFSFVHSFYEYNLENIFLRIKTIMCLSQYV